MRRKNWTKRAVAMGMSTMLFCTTPVFAQEMQTMEQTQEQGRAAAINKDVSGTCGKHLTWTLNKNTGILQISGTGAMEDYQYDDDLYELWAPWYNKYSTTIKTVIIDAGVTSIGEAAFAG